MTWPSGIKYRPLTGWPRELTTRHQRSPFSTSMTNILREFRREIVAYGARDVVLQVAIREGQLRVDGMPYANAQPEHPGVILSFTTTKMGAVSFPCDTFTTWQDNLLGIVRTMEKLRAIDRYGVTQNSDQYTAWRAIEAVPSAISSVEEALGVLAKFVIPEVIREDLVRAVRLAKREAHPDRGGDPGDFDRVARAEKYLREQGFLR